MSVKKSILVYTEWLYLIKNQSDKDISDLFKSILEYPSNKNVKWLKYLLTSCKHVLQITRYVRER